jgi:hypothetical protein
LLLLGHKKEQKKTGATGKGLLRLDAAQLRKDPRKQAILVPNSIGSGVDKTNADPFCSSSNNRLFFHLAIGHKDQLPDDLAPMLDAYRVSRLAFPVLTGSVSNIVMSFFA